MNDSAILDFFEIATLKRWLFFLGPVLSFLAFSQSCRQAVEGAEEPLALRQERLYTFLADRYSSRQTVPLSDSFLFELLPKKIAGYDTVRDQGATFHSNRVAFSEVRRIYYGHDNRFVHIRLADYAADSLGFLRIWDNYIHAEEGKTKGRQGIKTRPLSGDPWQFAWQWKDPRRELMVLEGGLGARYYLWIAVNADDRKNLLQEIWEKITGMDFFSARANMEAFREGD